jgi:hypothetical protein
VNAGGPALLGDRARGVVRVVVAAGGGETPIGPDLAARMLVVPEGPA